MNTYGFHGIHVAPRRLRRSEPGRPELQVWVITGDGDAVVGGNHLMHAIRRNVVEDHPLQQSDLRPDEGAVFADESSARGPRVRPTGRSTIRSRCCASPSARKRRSSAVRLTSTSSILTMVLGGPPITGEQPSSKLSGLQRVQFGRVNYASKKEEGREHRLSGTWQAADLGKNHSKGIRVSEMNRPEIVELGMDLRRRPPPTTRGTGAEPRVHARQDASPEFPELMGVFRDERPRLRRRSRVR